MTSAYRSTGLSGMSQAGALRKLLFSTSALRVRLTHTIMPPQNITEVTPSYLDGTWNACLNG